MNFLNEQISTGRKALLMSSLKNFDATLLDVEHELKINLTSPIAIYIFEEINAYAAVDSQGIHGFPLDVRLKSIFLFLLNQKAKQTIYKQRSLVQFNAGWLEKMKVTTLDVCEFLQMAGHPELIELVREI
jgi:hypothetical protein